MDEPHKPSNERDDDASAQLLSALLDGELSGHERREVLERVLADPEEAERFAHYRAQRDARRRCSRCRPPRPRCSCNAAPRAGADRLCIRGLAAGLLIGVALHAGRVAFGGEPAFAARADVAYATRGRPRPSGRGRCGRS